MYKLRCQFKIIEQRVYLSLNVIECTVCSMKTTVDTCRKYDYVVWIYSMLSYHEESV